VTQYIYIAYDIVSSRIYNSYYSKPEWYPAVLDNVFLKISNPIAAGVSPCDFLTVDRSPDVKYSPGGFTEFFALNLAKFQLLEFIKFEVDKSVIINTQLPYGGSYKIHPDFDEALAEIYRQNHQTRREEAESLFSSACFKICQCQTVEEVKEHEVFYRSLFLKDLA